MASFELLPLILAATLVHSPDPVPQTHPAEQVARAYFSTEKMKRVTINGIKVVGERLHQGQPAELVCVNITQQVRFMGSMTDTQALFVRNGSVVHRETGTPGHQRCMVI